MDVGQSLNPAIDIGQIEGAFTFGYGLYVLEEHIYSPEGAQMTTGPSNYKIPSKVKWISKIFLFRSLMSSSGVIDIPREFNVTLLKGTTNPRAIFSSRVSAIKIYAKQIYYLYIYQGNW